MPGSARPAESASVKGVIHYIRRTDPPPRVYYVEPPRYHYYEPPGVSGSVTFRF